ncbi:MAG: HAD-IC family P-type ATPase [Raineya sp.]|nr:HAD-IC family P-type ATPase [Raineya sp.]
MLWHTRSISEILETLQTSYEGLSSVEAQKRLNEFGRNELPQGKKVTLWQVVLHQFRSPLIYVLLAAGGLSVAIQEYEDAIFIFAIILLNGAIGTYQEWKAESSAAALKNLMKTQANVLRDGKKQPLDAQFLVKGDIVLLESGVKVPADLRLLQVHNLSIEEALLTGESLPVLKKTEPITQENVPLGDRLNMAYAGTTVMSGRGIGVVVATGLATEIGKIADSISEVGTQKVPLVERMERFAKKISVAVLVAAMLVVIIGWKTASSPYEIFFTAVAMAVSAIPEGLPVAMTVALAIATSRMAKRNVIVRKLAAVEGLGSCTYIASDKTGTLTVDQQTAREIILPNYHKAHITGEGYNGEGHIQANQEDLLQIEQIIEAVTLCNEASLYPTSNEWQYQGDAIDVALMALSYKIGKTPNEIRKEVEIIGEIPFESANKFAATFFRRNQKNYVVAKGAIEVFAEKTSFEDRNYFLEQTEKLAENGYRVIAVAKAEVEQVTRHLPENLQILGLIALIDPIKPEAKTAIDLCHQAGIQVGMITGDHPATALAIAKELHIAHHKSQVITGKELLALPESQIGEILQSKTVFARVSPEQKLQIVRALQEKGNFVAVTGDGVNDAPALKAAHIGVAMGYGTDVAKEASSIIVTDNNFASIAAGVEEGRYAYDNLRKIIYLLISTGFAEVIMILTSLIAGLPIPLLAVQLLWLNLVTNGIQDVALAFEKGEKEVMSLPPRKPQEGIFNRKMLEQLFISGFVIASLTFTLWFLMIKHWHYNEAEARNYVLLLMVLLQNFHAFNCRSERKSIFKIPLSNNWLLVLGVLVAQSLHILCMHIPFMANMLKIQPVSLQDWLLLLPLASIIVLVMEIYKRASFRKISYKKV